MRIVLILSHGQARVESGFSINSDILIENMLESTIVSQRIVYEGVKDAGGPSKVVIDASLLQHAKEAYSTYEKAKESAEKETKIHHQKRAEKRKNTISLNLAVAAKKAMVEEMKKKIAGNDAEIDSLQDQLKEGGGEGVERMALIFELF